MAAEDSMPVLTAATSKSSKTASSCDAMMAGGNSKTSVTSAVFWAVTAVMTDMANTPLADMALMSAWIPAPPPESEPAIVSPCFNVFDMNDPLPVVCAGEQSQKSDHTHEL